MTSATVTAPAPPTTPVGKLPILLGAVATPPASPTQGTAGPQAQNTPLSVDVHVDNQADAHKASVNGLLFSIRPTAPSSSATVPVGVDYTAFRDAGGADWSTRLHLVELPACALTTPTVHACQIQTTLPASTNDTATHIVSAPVTIGAAPATQNGSSPNGAVVLAAVAGPTGSNGTFEASSLKPSGSWSVAGNSGDFTWTYPISIPPVASGTVAPSIALSYDAQSVDGETAGTNTQTSWLGEGWDYQPGYIERTYRTCSSDTTLPTAEQTGDQCWAGQVVTMNLDGQATPMVHQDGSDLNDGWHPASDNGDNVQLVGQVDENRNYVGEYWEVTTTDGTHYYFGRQTGPGYSSQTKTNSVETEPVYGAHAGDPCYHANNFAGSSCAQAWRWNLDYVEDPHGNVTMYYYTPETNYYGADSGTSGVEYTRADTLTEIDYGLRDEKDGNGNNTVYSAPAPDRIQFNTIQRCDYTTYSCDASQFTAANASHWPDTPQDQQCLQGAVCNNHAPSFWSALRLGSITTGYANGSGGYTEVDNYALTQQFPGDADNAMVLKQVQRTGYAPDGTSITTPPITFDMQLLDNRVAGYHGLPGMARYRMITLTEDTGEKITVDYSPPQCTATNVPADPSQDTMYCFPVMWTPDGGTGQTADYYQKYVTTEVDVTDGAGRSPEEITQYAYPYPPAWHYDDNEIVKPVDRTYGQFRGFREVDVVNGNTQSRNFEKVPDQQTETKTIYFTGMDGDTLPNGATRSVSVKNFLGETTPDNDLFAGTAYETQTLNGVNGPEVSAQITNRVLVATTATRARTGLPALTANIISTAKIRDITDLAAGGTRSTSKTFSYDNLGRTVQETDSAPGLPDLCITTNYADNTSTWVRDKVDETIVSQQTCPELSATQPPTPSPILSDARTYYDASGTHGALTIGDATRIDTATVNDNGNLTFATTSTATFDSSGRPLSNTTYGEAGDTGNTTNTTYNPADGGILTETDTINAKQQKSRVILDPGRGLTTRKVDVAGNITDGTYDALGRLSAIWSPKQSKAAGAHATKTYSYLLQSGGPEAVTTNTLVDRGEGVTDYTTSIALYDSYGQQVQTQTQAEGGLTEVADTFYDSHGWVDGANNGYAVNGVPGTDLLTVNESEVDDSTVTTYDGAGRAVAKTNYKDGNATDSTQTIYSGDSTTVIPPQGGITQTTVTDALGRTNEVRQYMTPPTVTGSVVSGGTYAATDYGYTPLGKQNKITDADGDQWNYTYDMQGRQIQANAPDTGQTTYSYDLAGNLRSSTDARGQTLAYDYDQLNRKIGEYSGSTSGPELASWTYDTVEVGKLSQSNRYIRQGNSTIAFTVGVAEYDQDGNPSRYYVDVPPSVPGLAGYYETDYTYTSTDQVLNIEPSDGGGLPSEDIVNTYDSLGNLTGSSDDSGVYLNSATYTPYNEPGQYVLGLQGSGAGQASLNYTRDPQTHRVTNTTFSANRAIPQLDNTTDNYDLSGNIISSIDVEGATGAATQTQCNTYNALDQLTQAWTATDNCATEPTTAPGKANIGGPNPFWESWGIDPTGRRTGQTVHALPNATGGDTTTTYTYPTPGSPQADILLSTTASGPSGTTSTNYTYDPEGNTTGRELPGNQQTLTWDAENHLATDTTIAGTTSYNYDADGNLLLTQDATSATLYLPGEELIYDDSTQTITGTRYYTANGQTIALRVGNGDVEFLDGDQHSTMNTVYDPTNQTVSRRTFDPYGNQIGPTTTADGSGNIAPGSWPDLHTFLNDSIDPSTGLTSVGAREYDSATGRFISVDPQLNANDPQSLSGYTYADANPITHSDPSGLMITVGQDGPQCYTAAECNSSGYQTISDQWNQVNKGASSQPKVGPVPAPYVPISKHVLVQLSDPHYAKMLAAWQSFTSGMDVAKFSVVQELGIWGIVCGGGQFAKGGPVCNGSFLVASTQALEGQSRGGQGLSEGSIFLIGTNFPKQGGSIEITVDGIDSEGASDEDLAALARYARDQLGTQLKGKYQAYAGAYDPATGKIVATYATPGGAHAEINSVSELDIGAADAKFTKVFGYRAGNWVEIPICVGCQGQLSQSQFPPDVLYDRDGPWSQAPADDDEIFPGEGGAGGGGGE